MTGSAAVGSVLSVSPVQLSGASPVTFQVQWLRDTAAISGATNATYTTTASDIGSEITVQVTLSDGTVLTSPTGITVVAAPSNPATPTLTLADFTRDQIVYDTGAARGASVAMVPVSGTADPGADVQVRTVHATTAVEREPWTTVATAGAGGNWSGVIAVERANPWQRVQARLAANTGVTTETTHRFAAGHVLALWGQSEWHRMVLSTITHMAAPTVIDDDALQVTWASSAGNPEHHFITNALVDSQSPGRPLAALSNVLAAVRPGEKFHIAWQAQGGTSLTSTLYDGDDGTGGFARSWTDYDMPIHDLAFPDGNLPGTLWSSWWQAALSSGQGASSVNTIAKWLTGADLDGTPVTRGEATYGSATIDHFASDIYDMSTTRAIIAGPHRFEDASYGAAASIRARMDAAFQSPSFTAVAKRGASIIAYLNADGDIFHPTTNDADGYQRLATYTALDMLQGLGFGTWPEPEFDSAVLSPDSTTVTVSSSAGAITTTRLSRGGTLPDGNPPVWGFYIDGVLTAETEMVGGDVKIYYNAARDPFPDGTVIAFANGNVGSDDNPSADGYSWMDYPIVDLAPDHVEGIAIRPNTPQSVLGVIPASAITPDPNPSPQLEHADFYNAVMGTPGWTDPAASGWSVPGDGTLVADTINSVYSGQPFADVAAHAGKLIEVGFVLTTPDAAAGDLLVEVKCFGGGTDTLLTTTITPSIGDRNIIPVPIAVPSNRNTLVVRINRQTSAAGSFVFSELTVKEQ